jgi:hypothetical protein
MVSQAITSRCRVASEHSLFLQLIKDRELEAYLDGRARRITMRSIRARMARLLAAGRGTAAEAEQ